jgi:hypothetical protein
MKKYILALVVATLVIPAGASSAQRFGRRAGFKIDRVGLAQVWRLPTLSMAERLRLRDLQQSLFQELRDGGGRGAMRGRMEQVQAEVARIVGPSQAERARSMPRGPLTPEEILYYPITSLGDLAPARRAKIDAVFASLIEESRGDAPSAPGQPTPKRRERSLALFEVMEALLTREQLATVKQFLPEQLRRASFKEQTVMRLPSLTMEQEAKARAIFAAAEDETTADRARMQVIENELKASGTSDEKRRSLQSERREIRERLLAREEAEHTQLATVLTPEQMRQLDADLPGRPRQSSFTPETVRSL